MASSVLIIEDHPHIVEVLQKRLEAAGYTVLAAFDGQEGLRIARAEKPDLIILDIMLPRMNGYKVCRLLKFDAKYRSIPIFMLTSRMKKTDEETGRATGADEYIVKPYNPRKLLSLIKSYLKKSASTAAGAPETA